MREIVGDIWRFHEAGYWIVITTNGNLKRNGEAVMGRGVALQASLRVSELAKDLGILLRKRGNSLGIFDKHSIITFPTKHNFWEKADMKLIEKSAIELSSVPEDMGRIYMVRPGCENGGLLWERVKERLSPILSDRYVVVNR